MSVPVQSIGYCPNAAYFIACQAGVSSIAWGGVGVAKNALIEAVCAFLGYVAHVFIPSQHAPEDIGGVPIHDTQSDSVRMVMTEMLADLVNPMRWFFIDEGTSADTRMRPGLLGALNERRIGRLIFHPTTIVSMAANPPELTPNGSPLEPSICNRLYHHNWVFPSDLWHVGLMAGGKFPVPKHFPVVGDFSFLLPKYGGLVSLLCRNKPSLINADRVAEGTKAFNTPRSWWNLARALAAAEQCGYLEEVRAELCEGIVGPGPGAELMALIDARGMHNVEGILDGSETVKVGASTVDKLMSLPSALIMRLIELSREGEVDPAVITRAVEVMVTLAENDLPDAAAPCLGQIRTLFPAYNGKMPAKLSARWGKVTTALFAGGAA